MVNDNTREYSVYISDEASTVQGSGVLFYAGGDSMFSLAPMLLRTLTKSGCLS